MAHRDNVRSTKLPSVDRSWRECGGGPRSSAASPGEISCLTVAWAVMDLDIAGAHDLGLTLPDRHATAVLVAARAVSQSEAQIA
jgi:hypothetical protein